MRMTHDRKRHQLKRLHERGAEAQKVEATQTSINTLSTNLKIAIQVVDKISETINKIRDEELWPQVNELIQGYVNSSTLVCFISHIDIVCRSKASSFFSWI